MATQSLYRRYRPRRFAELRGQDHVVRALRNAVEHQRVGQAYLFSGPRGTGKTSSARILAKVLNCEQPVDGEPCCSCDSCLAVEAGTSYDVHELDAASNNGVAEMRELIEKAALGTPGRHKVYILDEVHMLSRAAEAALLKTLEEPPPHVVFVLATTDPQKVSETIRSRTQHLQFHLLAPDTLESHVRWIADDAGIALTDAAVQAVVARGAGSARDALSALELVAASGGELETMVRLDDLLDALADHDTGLALATLAHAVQQGHDPRVITEEIIRTMREAFLTLVAPELVQAPQARADALAQQAQRLGAAALVRAMEVLGEVLVEMRHAPDPRLLVEVAFVKLTSTHVDPGPSALLARIEHIEAQLARGASATPLAAPAAVDPVTGRARVGAKAARTAPASEPPSPPAATRPSPSPAAAPVAAGLVDVWPTTLAGLKPLVRALYAGGHVQSERDGTLTVALPNDHHRQRCEEHRPAVEAALAAATGGPVQLVLVADAATARDDTGPIVAPRPPAGRRGADPTPGAALPADDDIDLDELVDAPPAEVATPVDRLAEAFPGSELLDAPE